MKSIVDSITQALSGIAGLLTIDGMFAVGLVMSLAMTIVFVADALAGSSRSRRASALSK